MLSVVHCFSSRLYGLRKYDKPLSQDQQIQEQKTSLTNFYREYPPNSVGKIMVDPDSKLNQLWRHWLAGCPFVYNRCIEGSQNGFQGSIYNLEAQFLKD